MCFNVRLRVVCTVLLEGLGFRPTRSKIHTITSRTTVICGGVQTLRSAHMSICFSPCGHVAVFFIRANSACQGILHDGGTVWQNIRQGLQTASFRTYVAASSTVACGQSLPYSIVINCIVEGGAASAAIALLVVTLRIGSKALLEITGGDWDGSVGGNNTRERTTFTVGS